MHIGWNLRKAFGAVILIVLLLFLVYLLFFYPVRVRISGGAMPAPPVVMPTTRILPSFGLVCDYELEGLPAFDSFVVHLRAFYGFNQVTFCQMPSGAEPQITSQQATCSVGVVAPPTATIEFPTSTERFVELKDSAAPQLLNGADCGLASTSTLLRSISLVLINNSPAGQFIPLPKQESDPVVSWLAANGINNVTVDSSYLLMFNATVGQLEQTFRIRIHKYIVNGRECYSSPDSQSVPASLAPSIIGIPFEGCIPLLPE